MSKSKRHGRPNRASGPSSTRWAVLQELRQRGTARNIEIARALELSPGAVGYVIHQLRQRGHVKRLRTGVHKFVRMPDDLYYWEHEQHLHDIEPVEDGSQPEKILSLFEQTPDGVMSFRAVWKLSGLQRQVAGAVLSELVRRGELERVRRGLYRLRNPKSAAAE